MFAIYSALTDAFVRESDADQISEAEFAVDVTPLGFPSGWLVWSSFDRAAMRMTFVQHHLVAIDRTTHIVMSDVVSDFPIAETADRYVVDVTGLNLRVGELNHHVYAGGQFAAPTAPPVARLLPIRTFRQRFTLEEKIAFETLAQTDMTLRVLFDDLNAGPTVDLDHEDLVAGLVYLKTKAIETGLWADEDAAITRLQQIRA